MRYGAFSLRSIDRRETLPRWHQSRATLPMLIAGLLILPATTPSAMANPLAPIWTGAYIGLNGGVALADVDSDAFDFQDTSRAGFGGHVGYNLGLGSWMIGIEFDASHHGSSQAVSTAAGGSATFETDWQGTVRGRLGMSVGPALLYATAGWAWTGAALLESTPSGSLHNADATYNGVVYGIGAEAFILPSISLRLEALRFDYGTAELSVGDGFQALREVELQDTLIRAGVTIHLR
jgi:outer membrane immunogenic protein